MVLTNIPRLGMFFENGLAGNNVALYGQSITKASVKSVTGMQRSDTTWCASQNDITGLQGKHTADFCNQLEGGKYHLRGVAALAQLTVHLQRYFDGLFPRHATGINKAGYRAGAIKCFSALPRVAFLFQFVLYVTQGKVERQAKARHAPASIFFVAVL